MPQPATLKIIEVFPSLQGEGLRQGEPTVFVRLAGCNLKCSFCDTKPAWEGGTDYSAAAVADEVRRIRRRYPARWVCLTGGEPMLQDLRRLVGLLKKSSLKIQVETNATRYQPLPVDWYTVSPKPKTYALAPEYKTVAKEIKLVVTKELDLGTVRKMRLMFPPTIPVLLQVQSNARWSQKRAARLAWQAAEAGLANVRVSLQLHKILGIR
jgi:7-carboxy-7-deazaguanine synthase